MLLPPCRNFLADPIFVSPSPYHYMGPVSDPPTPSTPQPCCPIVFQRITNCPVYKLQFDFNKLNSKPSDSNGHHHLPTHQGANLLMLHHHTVFTQSPQGHLPREGFPSGPWIPPSKRATTHGESIKYKNDNKGERRDEEQSGGKKVGSTCPPIPGTGPTLYELPASSEGDTSAGQSRDLRKVWESHLKGNCLSSWDKKEGSSGRDALLSSVHRGPWTTHINRKENK